MGRTTYNIEIVGADHFDYMRGINSSSNPIWNNTVASFVTDLIIASTSKDTLKKFLDKNDYVKYENGIYVVRLPGCGI